MNKVYTIVLTSRYKKAYKNLAKRGLDMKLLDAAVYKISHGEALGGRYRDHVLKGKFKGFHECHIAPDWLLIYLIDNDVLTLTLVSTGTHADLFNL